MRSADCRSGRWACYPANGFTLVELAVVIAIVALLLGALLTPLATQYQMRRNKEAESMLEEIKEALIGYAVSQGRLPCPDTNADGLENPDTPPGCTATVQGFLPWQDLGVPATDPWGRLFVYRVTPELTHLVQTGPPGAANQFDLFDPGTVRVSTRGDNPALGGGGELKEDIVLTDDAAAAVASLGNNGAGGTRLDAVVMGAPAGGTDEAVNVDAADPAALPPPAPRPPHFYARRITQAGGGACDDTNEAQPFCEFDDLVIWIPRTVLMNRMLQAGRLP